MFPRIETPHHSAAVGSYGQLVSEHAATYGVTLRWWQELVFWRLLEHDTEGNLLWPEAAVSVARQVGKGYGGIRPFCEWRTSPGAVDLFGETQTVLHLSNQVNNVMEIAGPAIARARESGERVRLTNGEQLIERSDGSRWLMRSTSGAYGFSVSAAVVDECWDVEPRVIDSMVAPTMLERAYPQLVFWSTANSRATALYPRFRASAGEEEGRLVVEWSAPPGADHTDRSIWRLASPHWSPQRERLMARQLETANESDFRANYLNQWVDLANVGNREFAIPDWDSLPEAPADPGRGGIVAIDEARDASGFASATYVNGAVYLQYAKDVRELIPRANAAAEVLVGLSLVEEVQKAGLRRHPARYGAKETRIASPLLTGRYKSLAHNHDREMSEQAQGAVLMESEQGKVLSARRSDRDILGPKLVAWVLYHERRSYTPRAAIW